MATLLRACASGHRICRGGGGGSEETGGVRGGVAPQAIRRAVHAAAAAATVQTTAVGSGGGAVDSGGGVRGQREQGMQRGRRSRGARRLEGAAGRTGSGMPCQLMSDVRKSTAVLKRGETRAAGRRMPSPVPSQSSRCPPHASSHPGFM